MLADQIFNLLFVISFDLVSDKNCIMHTPYVRIDVASFESHQPYWGRSKDMQ